MIWQAAADFLPRCGMLLVGHGTRDSRGLAEFLQLTDQVRALAGELPVEPCFMELATPDICTGLAQLLDRGVEKVVVAPVMLFCGGHVKRDIPTAVKEALRRVECRENRPSAKSEEATVVASSSTAQSLQSGSPGKQSANAVPPVKIVQTPPFECHREIVELSAQRFHEALDRYEAKANRPAIDSASTLLLLVGRGSSDPTAIAGMQRFAIARAAEAPVGRVEVCFMAAASPRLGAALERAADGPYSRVVVQPHLLFAGEVLSEVELSVAQVAARHPERQWIVTARLGADRQVAKAVLDLVQRTSLESA